MIVVVVVIVILIVVAVKLEALATACFALLHTDRAHG